jgi:pimeloyl-ACP methyl ester carboxylesterase
VAETAFKEGHVEADGFHIRYVEAGDGPPLVHLHGAGGIRLSRTHELLAQDFRVIAFEMPGFGNSPENTRTQTMAELGLTMAEAAEALGLDRYNLWGISTGGAAALWLALQRPERILALVLAAPSAIVPAGSQPASGTPEEMARRLYGHPERMPPLPPRDPAVQARQAALAGRLRGRESDPDLEARMQKLDVPTVVLWGTLDRLIAPETGRTYRGLMPNCHFVLVYDCGHLIDAERPEACTEVIADFLERREAFVVSKTETVIHP